MAGQICQRLVKKIWRDYAEDLENVPEAEGIYVIGLEEARGSVTYLYVGHSVNIHRRLLEHKHQTLAIDKVIKEQFRENGGARLRIKWIQQSNSKLKEGQYIRCIEDKVGYPPILNIKGGNDN